MVVHYRIYRAVRAYKLAQTDFGKTTCRLAETYVVLTCPEVVMRNRVIRIQVLKNKEIQS